MEKVRVGFVGVGFMGQLAHLKNYALLPDCEVVAIAEPRRRLAELVAARYGVKKIYPSHKEMLEDCELDALVASQPFDRHAIVVPDILKAKKPLFTEKPLAASVEAGEELARLARENNVMHMVGYHKRSDPAMEYAKELIEEWKASGEYGRMKYVRITMPPGNWLPGAAGLITTDEPYPAVEREKKPDYFDNETAQKYISFVNYYIHQVNAMRFIMGEPYKLTFADRSGVLLAVESESGICGTIEMEPYMNTDDWNESVFVGFEKGYIRVDLEAPLSDGFSKVYVMRDNGKEPATIIQPTMKRIPAMRNQAMNFIAAVKGIRPAPCLSEEAVLDLKIAKDYIDMMNSYR